MEFIYSGSGGIQQWARHLFFGLGTFHCGKVFISGMYHLQEVQIFLFMLSMLDRLYQEKVIKAQMY